MSTQTLNSQRENVNARYIDNARARSRQSDDLESDAGGFVRYDQDDPILTLPIVEAVTVTAKKHPYAVIAAIVTAAVTVISTIVGAIVFVAVGAFTMYGTQRETLTELKALRQDYTEVSTRLSAIQKQQTDDMNAVRAYASNDSRRTEFIVGLMTPTQQRAVNQFDRANPRLELPGVPNQPDQRKEH